MASVSRDSAYSLLEYLAVLCEPHSGEGKILRFLARCALRSWVNGDLRVETRLEGMFECQLVLMCGIGGDSFEVMKRLHLSASFLTFRQEAETPEQILPFRLTLADTQRLVFDATSVVRQASIPPPAFAEAQRRLEAKLAITLPPSDVAQSGGGDDQTPSSPPPVMASAWEQELVPEDLPLVMPSAQAVARVELSRPVARIKLEQRFVPQSDHALRQVSDGPAAVSRRDLRVDHPSEAPEPEPQQPACDEASAVARPPDGPKPAYDDIDDGWE